MNSIFHDDNLLEALIRIGQEKSAPTNLDQLKNTALKLIDNLKQDSSPIKANSNPSFTDLKSLDAFTQWARSSGATFAGQPVVDDKGADAEGLQALLLDLRKKAVGSKGLYSEAIANLIMQLNKNFGTKIDQYEPAEVKPGAGTDPANPGKNKGVGNASVNVKVDQSSIDGVNGTPGAAGTPNLFEISKSGGLSLLDGLAIDFDETYLRANQISNYVMKMEPRVAAILTQVVNKIGNVKHNFDMLTAKSPNLNTLGCYPSDGSLEIRDRIKSTFNAGVTPNEADKTNAPTAYRYDELAKIAIAFSSLMVEVGSFYYILQRIPSFAQLPELQKQMEWSKLYKTNFMDAAGQFSGQHQSATQI